MPDDTPTQDTPQDATPAPKAKPPFDATGTLTVKQVAPEEDKP